MMCTFSGRRLEHIGKNIDLFEPQLIYNDVAIYRFIGHLRRYPALAIFKPLTGDWKKYIYLYTPPGEEGPDECIGGAKCY